MKQTLYKYVPLSSDEHLSRLERLLEGLIYYPSPGSFNDPFEMSPIFNPPALNEFLEVFDKVVPNPWNFSKSARIKIHQGIATSAAARTPVSQEWINTFGVLCLTTKHDNLLMWAHYASNHSGVCIGFDSEIHPFSSAQPVNYMEERPRVSLFNLANEQRDLVEKVLFTKSVHWEYEHEWRAVKRAVRDDEKSYYFNLVSNSQEKETVIANLLASEGGPGIYQFDPNSIRCIYLGAKISSEHKRQVLSIMRNLNHPARIVEYELDPRYFRLNPKKISRR